MTWFHNLHTRTKLIVAFGVLSAMIAGLGWFARDRLAIVNAATVEVATGWLPKTKYAGVLNTATSDYRVAEVRALLSATPEAKRDAEAAMAVQAKNIATTLDVYTPLISRPEGKRMMAKFREQWDAYLGVQRRLIELARAQGRDAVEPLIGSESLEFLGQLKGLGYIPAVLMEDCDQILRMAQAGGMTQFAGQRQGLPAPLQGLLGIAEHPK
jgi:methyl-accepting chemotaxis protein